MDLNQYGDKALGNQIEKGFDTPRTIIGDDGTRVMAKLMLVVTELSEATEAIRDHDVTNFEEEIADTLIRLLGTARGLGMDIDHQVLLKMQTNEGRAYQHGRVKAI